MFFIFKDYFRQRYLFLGNCPIYLEQFKRIIPTFWYSETEECYLSIVDVVAVLTDNDYQTAPLLESPFEVGGPFATSLDFIKYFLRLPY